MSEQQPNEPSISEQLRLLGKNLTDAMRTAWERPERKQAQQDIINGLNELGNTIRQTANDFSKGQTGQRMRGEAEDLRQRMHSGEVGTKMREELLHALHMVNTELEQAINRMERTESGQPPQATPNYPPPEPPTTPEPPQDTGPTNQA